ncbi:hypothetical protein A3Q56_02951 [Intoshia linei]|uniref:Uncharacterized protein n=1 Tax=Intoshia linei TaxID=1819745 RepID=A0A177B6N9_9BILA|nr:hypothetical protein A3Q56_02951 [Intoshia linei]
MENKQNKMFNQILDKIDENNYKEYIFINPPDAHDLTEEDSAETENKKKNFPSVLSGNQLRAPSEKRHIVNDSDCQKNVEFHLGIIPSQSSSIT